MSTESKVLLSSLSEIGTFTGDKCQGSSYHKLATSMHTIIVSFSNWSGELRFQGTLALYPAESDWFELKDLDNNSILLGDGSTDYDDSYAVSSIGNFVWLRAVGSISAGTITEIRYNY
jgi:hypothetical protein